MGLAPNILKGYWLSHILRKCFNTWERHTGAGRLQELPVVHTAAVEARTVAGETDQDTPGVTSHCLGRAGVGLPCCLCLSFALISATTQAGRGRVTSWGALHRQTGFAAATTQACALRPTTILGSNWFCC